VLVEFAGAVNAWGRDALLPGSPLRLPRTSLSRGVCLWCLLLALLRPMGWVRSGPLSRWNRTSARRLP